MCLGAIDNSFLVRENIIDVLTNTLTGLQVRHHDSSLSKLIQSNRMSPSAG